MNTVSYGEPGYIFYVEIKLTNVWMYMDSKTVANGLASWSWAQEKKKKKKTQQKEFWGRKKTQKRAWSLKIFASDDNAHWRATIMEEVLNNQEYITIWPLGPGPGIGHPIVGTLVSWNGQECMDGGFIQVQHLRIYLVYQYWSILTIPNIQLWSIGSNSKSSV